MENFYRNKKALITGGLGFIGSNLAKRLVELGAEVLIVDSLIEAYGGNLFNINAFRNDVRVNISDIRDEHSLRYLVQGQDIIFNLAGQVSHLDSMQSPYADLEINCRSQLSLLEACRHTNPGVKVVYAGTRQVYGAPQYLPVDEAHPIKPSDVNGINKIAGERYHNLYWEVYDIPTCVLRLTNTYGPRQMLKHNRQGFIYWFTRLALEGKEIALYGDGSQIRDFCYVDDAVEAFLLAGASEKTNGQVYNVGGAEVASLLTFVETLLAVTGSGSYRLVPWPPARKRIDIGDYYADYSKIRRELGWQPLVSLRQGLDRTIRYYREFGEYYWQ